MWTIGNGSICIGYFDFESVSFKVYFIKVYFLQFMWTIGSGSTCIGYFDFESVFYKSVFFTVYATFSALVCGLLEVAVYALVIGHRLSTLTQPS